MSNNFCNSSWLRTRDSIISCEDSTKQSKWPITTEAAKAVQRKRSSNWILQPPPSNKPHSHLLKEDPFIIFGYSCLVHEIPNVQLKSGCKNMNDLKIDFLRHLVGFESMFMSRRKSALYIEIITVYSDELWFNMLLSALIRLRVLSDCDCSRR